MADQKQDMPKITVLYFVLKKTNSKFGFPSRGPHSSCHSPPLLKSRASERLLLEHMGALTMGSEVRTTGSVWPI